MELINRTTRVAIDLESYGNLSPDHRKLVEILSKEIEIKRSELIQQFPDFLLEGLLGKSNINRFEITQWDEILSGNLDIVSRIADIAKTDRTEVLNCVLLLDPPRWKEFFWQLQYEKIFDELTRHKLAIALLKHESPDEIATKKVKQEKQRQATLAEYKANFSSSGGIAKVVKDKDGKQAAKTLIEDCWVDWQKYPDRYSKQSDFVTDVLTKIPTDNNDEPIISFDTVLKKWIPDWTKNKK